MDKNNSVAKLKADSVPVKLKLLITIVNREKAEFYTDFLQDFDINMQITLLAHGTAKTEMLAMLGLEDIDKAVIISVIRADRADEALTGLERKFYSIKNGKGIACTVPLSSTIGVSVYRFLSNNRKGADTKRNSLTK